MIDLFSWKGTWPASFLNGNNSDLNCRSTPWTEVGPPKKSVINKIKTNSFRQKAKRERFDKYFMGL